MKISQLFAIHNANKKCCDIYRISTNDFPMQAIGVIISPSLKADDLKMGGDKWQPVQ